PPAPAGARRSAARGRSPRLLVRSDVVDSLADGLDLLRVLVRDLDPELVLELHDQLDEVEGVGVEILLEGSLLRDVRLVDAELLGEDLLDPLVDFLARRCHVTSFSWGLKARRSYRLLTGRSRADWARWASAMRGRREREWQRHSRDRGRGNAPPSVFRRPVRRCVRSRSP